MTDKHSKKSVLVPVDFSPDSEAALVKAAEIAQAMDLPVTVLHVVHDPSDMPGYYAKFAKKKHLLRMQDIAAEVLEEFIARVSKKHPALKKQQRIESMLVVGVPVNRILEVAKKIKASMVVMGSKGRTGLEHLLLGSRAEHVVQLCPIPVMIVKSESE